MNCERCGKENYFLLKCNSCNRKVCRECEKSGKLISTHEHLTICKDCWSKMDKRKAFKSA